MGTINAMWFRGKQRRQLKADHHQFRLCPVELSASEREALIGALGTVEALDEAEFLSLTTFRQYGRIDVEFELFRDRAPDLGAQWQDVVEFSVRTPADVLRIESFDAQGDGPALSVKPGGAYRVRYATRHATRHAANAPSDGDGPGESYRVEVWPAPHAAPALVRASLPALYWHAQRQSRHALEALPAGAAGRTERMIEAAFDAYPELPRALLAGEEDALLPVLAFTEKVRPHELSDFHRDELILAVARRHVGRSGPDAAR